MDNEKTHKPSDVQTIDIKDETSSESTLAMYQILTIIDKIKVTFTYRYKTFVGVSGMDIMEANKLKT